MENKKTIENKTSDLSCNYAGSDNRHRFRITPTC